MPERNPSGRIDPVLAASVGAVALVVIVGLSDNPWIVWPTLVSAVIAAFGVVVHGVDWLLSRWRTLEVTYISPDAAITRKTPKYHAISIPPGKHHFSLEVRAKKGLTLTGISPAFFGGPRGVLRVIPRQHGNEIARSEIIMDNMRFRKGTEETDKWFDMTPEHSTGGKLWRLGFALAPGRRVIFDCAINIVPEMACSSGIMSFGILFDRRGEPNEHRKRLPFYVSTRGNQPLRWKWKQLRRRRVLTLRSPIAGTGGSPPAITDRSE